MDINALLKQAQQEIGNTLIKRQANYVWTLGEHRKVGGKDDYPASVLAIVNRFGSEGVMLSLLREVLHNTELLNTTVEALADAGKVVKGKGKRDFLLTPGAEAADQPPATTSLQPPAPVSAPAVVTPEKKSSPKPATSDDGDEE